MSENVSIMFKEFNEKHSNHPTMREVIAEIKDIEGAISNEKIWLLGSIHAYEREMRAQNLNDLIEYKQVLTMLL